ncbi:MAG TPA: DUF4384 domain-containing protein, partial [candidate division Zixibacteria bacterium]|nr:DUF4384 domain-containing protein [candidate division Zixibacteria bacterium]
ISIQFRANKDCYVVIYNIDTRGNVNLLYPSDQWDDDKIERDRIYRIPNSQDDYELTVRGPEGIEYIQIVASRTPIRIPDWDNGFDMVVDGDPLDFLDYINAVYFGCDNGCSLAFDMALFTVNEWHEAYYRPVHVYHHNDWSMCGMIYIDYPWGATVYIDGIYWGIAPLFIPRIYYGWHYVTIYDRFGYCWEDRINVFRRKSVVLDNTIIKTRAGVKSKYRDVRRKAYLDPSKNGYPDYAIKKRAKKETWETMRAGKSGASIYKNRAKYESRESTSTRINKSKSRRSSETDTYRKHKSKSGRSSSTYQSERKRSAKKTKSSTKSSGKINESGKSRKEKPSPKSSSGRSGSIKKMSPGKSSSSSAGKRSSMGSSRSKSSKSSQSNGKSIERKSSRGRR